MTRSPESAPPEWEPERLFEDVVAKPAMLRALAAGIREATAWRGVTCDATGGAVQLVGIGSSRYAAEVAARRLRRLGITAFAETSSAERLTPVVLNVVISAGGSSIETLAATESLRAAEPAATVVALTNSPDSPLTRHADAVVALDAGVEVSGVASRSFAATLVRLLELEIELAGGDAARFDLADRVETAAHAVDDIVASRDRWLADAVDELAGPHGTWLLSPAHRSSSALQAALMLREVPRRPATGCETGEWSHVDVYLTKTLDYRAIVFTGSRWDAHAVDWLTRRGSLFWAVGGDLPGAARVLRYAADDDAVVALLAEVTIAELLAAALPPSASA